MKKKQNIRRYKKRGCLKCGEAFISKGPYNCICEKCTYVNERTLKRTYSVRGISLEGSGPLEEQLLQHK